ncbi:sigma-70 family RNA polymerase sigma factor [Sedimentibacter sp.]|uniref:sigma-70 family RNA polymerase sigma factor n=1 Tax=Sedimentibacter sp. TaxID=1960295 RepID=UPI0028A90647|nr:sigma-70 family RNA polymerase sigma factor [Sedimentibacter sp.]
MDKKADTDINYIIQMSLKGDKKYQEILLNELKPLICKNIFMYWSLSDPIAEDLLQEGYIVVLQSLKDFDMNKGVHFLAFIHSKIKYFYINCYKKSLKDAKNLNCYPDIDDLGIVDFKENTEKKILENEKISLLKTCIDMLSAEEQQLIYCFYFDEIPIGEIAKDLNISYSAACSKKSRIIKKLRNCVLRR